LAQNVKLLRNAGNSPSVHTH